MSSLMKKIEVAANVAIIAVAILLGATLLRSYLSSRALLSRAQTQTTQPVAAIQPGTQLSLPGIDWQTNGRTLILALSTECHFCTDSAPFYHRVAEERAKNGNLRLLAVLPQPVDESQKYLKELGVVVDEVKQLKLDSMGVEGTPTLLMANSSGRVVDSWRGRLSAEREADVLNRLKQPVQ